ncbi:MAG TPA: hypothetical protein VMT85_07465 [Thermoanaerobaculia bacterium]|nr:hypothetical protein [Thermoanaerobaculia bacterium]
MAFLEKLFGRKKKPVERVRICVECGMPSGQHKEWCSILKGEQRMAESRKAAAAANGS